MELEGRITSEGVPDNVNSYGVLQISISGVDDEAVNAAPTVTNDTAYVYEDYVVTAVNGASANDGYSSAPFQVHTQYQQIVIIIVPMEIIQEICFQMIQTVMVIHLQLQA
jgi:uncharacterized protein YaaQ